MSYNFSNTRSTLSLFCFLVIVMSGSYVAVSTAEAELITVTSVQDGVKIGDDSVPFFEGEHWGHSPIVCSHLSFAQE